MASPHPSLSPEPRRRSSLWSTGAFVGVAILAAAASFAAGMRLHDPDFARRRLSPSNVTRLAQADEFGVRSAYVPRLASDKHTLASDANDRRAEEKRVRDAADTFEQVYSLVREHYVDALPGDRVFSQGAVRSMVSALEDDQSFFLTPDQRAIFDAEAGGRFAGVGAITAIRSAKTKEGYSEERLIVVAPIPGSPAAKGGLETGDRIVRLDGRYILGDSPYLEPDRLPKPAPTPTPVDPSEVDDDANGRIRDGIGLITAQMQLRQGATGEHSIVVQRPGTATPLRFTLQNAITESPKAIIHPLPNTDGTLLDVQIPAFTEESVSALKTALRTAPEGQPILLDLRQNPGIGSLDAAEEIAALFGVDGTFAVEIGVSDKRTILKSHSLVHADHHPISVLTDGGTASLAEALAASLTDDGMANIVSNGRTFGDGRVQTLYPLPDGSAFTLTTGRFVGPRGTGWEGVGLAPKTLLPRDLTSSEVLKRAALVALQRVQPTVAQSVRKQGAH